MQIIDDPNFLALPDDLSKFFSEAAQQSFFNLPGWYDLMSRFGMRAGWRPRLIVDDHAKVALVCQTAGAASELTSCVNPYSCEHAVIASDADRDSRALQRLTADIGRGRPRRHRIQLSGLDPADPSFNAMRLGFDQAGFVSKPYFGWGTWQENVAGKTFEDYLAGRPSSLLHTWKRKRSALQKTSQGAFHVHASGEDVEPFIADYEEVYRQSWKEPEPFPRFVPELIRFAASLGVLRMGVLRIGGEPAAAQFWIGWQKTAMILKLAYVGKFREFSPGTLLTMHMLQHVFERDRPAEIGFGRGDDDYKKLWVSERRERWGIDAANPRTLRGLVLAAAMAGANVRNHVRRKAR